MRIKDQFLKGIQKIYELLGTTGIQLCMLDTQKTEVNVYNESPEEIYKDPVNITGSVSIIKTEGEESVEYVQEIAIFTIPTKEFIDNNISYSTYSAVKELEKAKIVYSGTSYSIDRVEPKDFVDSTFQEYAFYCKRKKG